MKRYASLGLVLLGLALGCGGAPEPDSGASERSPAAETEAETVEQVLFGGAQEPVQPTREPLVLHRSRTDSVMLEEVNRSRKLVWLHRSESGGGWREVWRSRDLYGGTPSVIVDDLNGDGTVDLFWSMHYEEIVAGLAVFQVDGRTLERYPAGIAQCRAPELKKTGNGYRLVAYESGAYPSVECGGAIPALCPNGEWPRYFAIRGTEFKENVRAADYTEVAQAYRRTAAHLDSLFATESGAGGEAGMHEGACGSDFPDRLRALADSADRRAATPHGS